LPKFEAIKGKSWSPRTMVAATLVRRTRALSLTATFEADVILRMRRELGGL